MATRRLALVHLLFDDSTMAIHDPQFLQRILGKLGYDWDGRAGSLQGLIAKVESRIETGMPFAYTYGPDSVGF